MSDPGGNKPLPAAGFVSFTKKWHSEPYETISPFRPELSAVGKNVVVSGGGTGIGKAIATAFAQAGASSVAILGRREDRLITSCEEINAAAPTGKTRALYRVTDLNDKANVQQSFKGVAAEVGKLHILVSNAGVFPDMGSLSTYDVELFMSGFGANVRGALNAVQAFIPLASPQGATILNISTATTIAPVPSTGAYIVSKAANHKMMDFIAVENPQLHVVNVVPGVIETEMAHTAKISLPHWDSLALPGEFCVWLASPEAKFLKSKVVWANWDADELKARADEIKSSRLLTWLLDGVPM